MPEPSTLTASQSAGRDARRADQDRSPRCTNSKPHSALPPPAESRPGEQRSSPPSSSWTKSLTTSTPTLPPPTACCPTSSGPSPGSEPGCAGCEPSTNTCVKRLHRCASNWPNPTTTSSTTPTSVNDWPGSSPP